MTDCAKGGAATSPHMRLLLFATELYALPILRPLAAAAQARGDEAIWFVRGAAAAHLHASEPALRDAPAVRAWRPDAVIAASNWVPHFFPGVKVEVFHGFNVEKRPADRGHFRIRDLFDLYCTQGPATTGPFQAMERQLGHFRVVETGWPKLDPLFQPARNDDIAIAANGRKVVAYASTFTESLTSAPHLYDTIARHVEHGEHYWLLTLHPKSDPVWGARYRALAGPNARFFEADELIPMLRAADVMLCDTSSAVPEFAVQGKPVVTFRNRAPKPYMIDIRSPEQVDAALQRAFEPDRALHDALERLAAQIHPYRDGRSSERVLDAVAAAVDGHLRAPRAKPANLTRKLQMRWRLRYFGRSG